MPPKKASRTKPKKVVKTPEELQADFENWKESPEFELLTEMYETLEDLKWHDHQKGMEADMTILIEPFMVPFLKVPAVFKVKKAKIKPVIQSHIRVGFFVGVSNRANGFQINGEYYKFSEQFIHVDGVSVSQDFIEFTRYVKSLYESSVENYIERRKTLVEQFQRFAKGFKKFTKKGMGYQMGRDMMNLMLKDLVSLMECNMGITVVDFEYPDEIGFEVNNFRYKALITDFCKTYMVVQNTLFKNPNIDSKGEVIRSLIGNPDVYSILKKFQYLGWRQNKVESFYIQPLLNAFLKMRANMSKLYLMGFSRIGSL